MFINKRINKQTVVNPANGMNTTQAIKRNRLLPYAAIQVILEATMSSEINQRYTVLFYLHEV